ncbi:aspartate kinase [Hanamia caeni]|uniref:Aspartokinase n=1 Tax=Hanamia caeni TaxID=2294116 RepID=A0A3M9NHQ9_9BACT|nr:aspartate kinase [Hanamia caeni]RNI37339.1 aspartate kinase [Hanamia caeni]
MKIMKFGGTSVGKPERMAEIRKLITKDDETKIIVLSALSGTTNALTEISDALSKGDREEAKKRIDALESHYQNFIVELLKDETYFKKAKETLAEHFEFLNIILKISYSEALNKDILAQGELLSTKLFSIYLNEQEIAHVWLPALEFMSIDQNNEPQVASIREKLSKLLDIHKGTQLFVTQGYICRNAKGEIDNLKRGGSDYSASLIAAAVDASVCEIWTDISGMHNNDPRVVKDTKPVKHLCFEEAAELAYFGAKILHPASIWPAQYFNFPVRLLNTMEPDAPGTLIERDSDSEGVKAIAAKDFITAIKIKSSRMLLAYGFLRKVFEVFEKYQTSIDMVTTSEVAVSLTIDNDTYLNDIIRELEMFGSIEIDKAQTIVSIVGYHVAKTENLLAKVFDSLTEIPVRMVSFGGSQHNISILVAHEHKEKTLQLLSHGLFD